MDIAIALGIGVRLQEDVRDLHVVHALDQRIDVAPLLRRILVIDVVEVDMHYAHVLLLTHLSNLAGKGFQRWVVGDQDARNIFQVRRVSQTLVEGKGHPVAMLMDQLQRRPVGSPVGPDPGARCFAGDFGDFIGHQIQVLVDARLILLVGFILAGGLDIGTVGNGGLLATLRVRLDAVVGRPGVRPHLNQRRLAHLLHHLPGGKLVTRRF